VRTYADEYEGGLLLYGDMINNSGVAQKVAFITGAFYDAQGQLIAGQDSTIEHWPVDVIPPGGRVPFELAVNGIQATANYKLWANSEATGQTPYQDFNFSEVEQWQEEDVYCLTGQLQKPVGELQEYLVIVATLYDGQGNVVNFSDRYESNPQAVVDGDTLEFEICVDPPYQDVARYELRAWGE
jgi:hypothetical protein